MQRRTALLGPDQQGGIEGKYTSKIDFKIATPSIIAEHDIGCRNLRQTRGDPAGNTQDAVNVRCHGEVTFDIKAPFQRQDRPPPPDDYDLLSALTLSRSTVEQPFVERPDKSVFRANDDERARPRWPRRSSQATSLRKQGRPFSDGVLDYIDIPAYPGQGGLRLLNARGRKAAHRPDKIAQLLQAGDLCLEAW